MDEAAASAYVLDNSYAAQLGKAIEPVFEPLGFDWRINVGLIGSFAAREVFVSTMGQIVAAENTEDPSESLQGITYSSGEHEGEKVFSASTLHSRLHVCFSMGLSLDCSSYHHSTHRLNEYAQLPRSGTSTPRTHRFSC